MHRFVGELRETLFACLNPLLPIEPPLRARRRAESRQRGRQRDLSR